MIAIVDYGVGNLFSVCSSLKKIGAEAVVTADKKVMENASKIILPGVGAFADAIAKLKGQGLDEFLISQAEKGKYIMGICLGMQMLFEKSFEYGEYQGLGLIKGKVVAIDGIPSEYKIPHIGWNALHFKKSSPIFKYLNDNDHVYFVHSFHAVDCDQALVATTEYGKEITAVVQSGKVYGCQFHPEKSGTVGLNILKAFCEEN